MNRDEFQQQAYAWLNDTFDDIYPNPKNTIMVPYGATLVTIDGEELGDGRLAVHIRASILRDLDPTDDLITHVALSCNHFHFGNLYLFAVEDDKVDLDYSNKVLSTGLRSPEDLVELVAVAGNNALEIAAKLQERFGGHQLNPTEKTWHTTYIGPEAAGRQDVWQPLNTALETQACIVMGTAERIELTRIGALNEGWFVINPNYLWFAGRDVRTRTTVLWRIPHSDIRADHPIPTHSPATYTAELANGDTLTVTTRTTDAALAIHDAHHDPRDLNHRFEAA